MSDKPYRNLLNLDRSVQNVLLVLEAARKIKPSLLKWVGATLRRQLITEEDPISWANSIGARLMHVVTAREYRAYLNFNKYGLTCYVLQDSDYVENPWLEKALRRGDDIVHFDPRFDPAHPDQSPIIAHFAHLCETLEVSYPERKSYMEITHEDAVTLAKQWQERLEREASLREGLIEDTGASFWAHNKKFGPNGHAVLSSSYDELKIWRLLDKQAFVREGTVMHHCLGSGMHYDSEDKDTHIYSIRTVAGESVATAEVRMVDTDKYRLMQMQGRPIENVQSPPATEEIIEKFKSFLTLHYQDRKPVEGLPFFVPRGNLHILQTSPFDSRFPILTPHFGAEITDSLMEQLLNKPEFMQKILDSLVKRAGTSDDTASSTSAHKPPEEGQPGDTH